MSYPQLHYDITSTDTDFISIVWLGDIVVAEHRHPIDQLNTYVKAIEVGNTFELTSLYAKYSGPPEEIDRPEMP